MSRAASESRKRGESPVKYQSPATTMTLRSRHKKAQSAASSPISGPPEAKIMILPSMPPKKKPRTRDTSSTRGSIASVTSKRSTPSIPSPLPHQQQFPRFTLMPDLIAEDCDSDGDDPDNEIVKNPFYPDLDTIRSRAFLKLHEEGFYAFSMKEHLKEFEADRHKRPPSESESVPAGSSSGGTHGHENTRLATPGATPSGVSTPSSSFTSSATKHSRLNFTAKGRITRSQTGTGTVKSRARISSPVTTKQMSHDLMQDKQNVLHRHRWAMQDFRDGIRMLEVNAGRERLAKGVSEQGTEEYRKAVVKTAEKLAEIQELWGVLVKKRPKDFGEFGKRG